MLSSTTTAPPYPESIAPPGPLVELSAKVLPVMLIGPPLEMMAPPPSGPQLLHASVLSRNELSTTLRLPWLSMSTAPATFLGPLWFEANTSSSSVRSSPCPVQIAPPSPA